MDDIFRVGNAVFVVIEGTIESMSVFLVSAGYVRVQLLCRPVESCGDGMLAGGSVLDQCIP